MNQPADVAIPALAIGAAVVTAVGAAARRSTRVVTQATATAMVVASAVIARTMWARATLAVIALASTLLSARFWRSRG